MVRYLLRFSYIGTPFSGVQRQARQRVPTVADALEHTLAMTLYRRAPKEIADAVRVFVSSRTDTGVHAMCNTCTADLGNFDSNTMPEGGSSAKSGLSSGTEGSISSSRDGILSSSPEGSFSPAIIAAVNRNFASQLLPVRLLWARAVAPGFSARRHAKQRVYVYRLVVPASASSPPFSLFEFKRSWCLDDGALDMDRMRRAAEVLAGEHNFRSFTTATAERAGKCMVKRLEMPEIRPADTVFSRWDYGAGQFRAWDLVFRSRSFLHRQVRRMTGVLVAVGGSRLDLDQVRRMLDEPAGGSWPAARARVAPPHGLYLADVVYDEREFDDPPPIELRSDEADESDDNFESCDEVDEGDREGNTG